MTGYVVGEKSVSPAILLVNFLSKFFMDQSLTLLLPQDALHTGYVAVMAGLDMVMPKAPGPGSITTAIKNGSMPQSIADNAAIR